MSDKHELIGICIVYAVLVIFCVLLHAENCDLNERIDKLIDINQNIYTQNSELNDKMYRDGWATGVDLVMFTLRHELEANPKITATELYNSNAEFYNLYNSSLVRRLPII